MMGSEQRMRRFFCATILCLITAFAYADDVEDVFWESVVKGNAQEEYGLYLERYPNGRYAGEARRKIEALRAKERPRPKSKPKPKPAPPEVAKGAEDGRPGVEEAQGRDSDVEAARRLAKQKVEQLLAESKAEAERAEQEFRKAEQQWADNETKRLQAEQEAKKAYEKAMRQWEEKDRAYRAAMRQWEEKEAERQRLEREAKQPPAEREGMRPGRVFKDCPVCPEMVILPRGSFIMGSPKTEIGRDGDEGPQHKVNINYDLAVGKFEVTFDEWNACTSETGRSCDWYDPPDGGWGRGRQPVIMVSWDRAQSYVKWLSRKTGKPYRLLSEAEWEYAARAGTTTPYHVGNCIYSSQANYEINYAPNNSNSKRKCPEKLERHQGQAVKVGSYPANAFGLHDMIGNVWEWVQDCWAKDYSGAPTDGSAYQPPGCLLRAHRGGAWNASLDRVRSAGRGYALPLVAPYSISIGFRVARPLK